MKNNIDKCVLPDREEMMCRLSGLNETSYVRQKLHPLLMEYASQKFSGEEVVEVLALAIYECTQGMSKIMANMMCRRIPVLIDTLIDDKSVADEARDFFQTIQ